MRKMDEWEIFALVDDADPDCFEEHFLGIVRHHRSGYFRAEPVHQAPYPIEPQIGPALSADYGCLQDAAKALRAYAARNKPS